MRPKTYRLFQDGRLIASRVPGRYAGITTQKIFGRLDCRSGKRALKKNRIFFLTWEDAVAAGYRPCKNCRPQPDDRY